MDTTGRGHGGRNGFDQGATGSGTTEYKEVSAINDYFRKFNPNWADVSDFSATNVNQNLINIVNNTNAKGKSSERTLSHHMNAFNGKATGVEVWYYAGDSLMAKKAAELSAAISKALGLVNRGAKATTSLYVVSNTYPHCLLIEWCFVDNRNDIAAWNKNKVAAMNAALKVLGMKTGSSNNSGGGTTVSKPQEKNYYQSGHYFEALQDLKTYNKAYSKVDKTWMFKKGTKFAVRKIVKMPNGATHAQVAGLGNTYVTLSKKHVKPQ